MSKNLRVLILEDSESDALLLQRELTRGGYELEYEVAATAAATEEALDRREWDVIISDYSMPGFSAPAALAIVRKRGLDIPVIIVSGTIGEETAVAAMKAGAADYFTKDNLTRLAPAVEREVRDAAHRRQRRIAEAEVRKAEARFARAFHASPVGISIARLSDGVTLDVNQRLVELIGYEKEQLIGRTTLDRYLWRDPEQHRKLVDQLRENGSVRNVEVEFRRASGQLGQGLLSAEKIELEDEPCFLTMLNDITERIEAEERVRRSNELIRLLRDIAAAANRAVDVDDILQYTIEKVCAYASWDVGHAFLVPADGVRELRSASIWHTSGDPCLNEFRRQTETAFDAAEAGLIREAFDSRSPQCLENVATSSDFVRAEVAAACGLRGGYALPIIADQSTMGVFEFFSRRAPDEAAKEILEVTTQIGTQVGRVIERQRAQTAMRESEARYRALFDRSLDAVYVHDFEGNFIDANPAALKLLGYERQDLITLNFRDLLAPEEIGAAFAIVEQTIEKGFQHRISEFRLRRRDGSFIFVETLSSVIQRSGKPWAIQGIARDISERKAAELARQRYAEQLEQRVAERTEELNRAKDHVEAILSSTSDAVILIDEHGTLLDANPALASQFGEETRKLIGLPVANLLLPSSLKVFREAVGQAISSGRSVRCDVQCISSDGTQFESEFAIAPVTGRREESTTHLVCAVHDITKRKQIEEALRNALAEERELNDLKTRFTTMVSHEFRTPLAVIMTSASLLRQYADRLPEEKRRAKLMEIEAQVERVVEMLDDVLSLSRAEKIDLEMSAEPADLTVLFADTVKEIQSTTTAHSILFSTSGPPRLAVVDANLVRQALRNLLSNAVKYSPAGTRIDLELHFEADQIRFIVRDRGIGIPEEDLKRLFEPFHRARNVGTLSGTGIGLAIVDRVVKAHKGSTDVQSAVGEGTSFTVTLPNRPVP